MDTIEARTGAKALLGGALLALPLLLAAAAIGPAAAAVITSCGARITAPGTYVLANDLSCPSGAIGVRISASNVRLDLNGHAITGSGCVGLVGILVLPLSDLPPLTGVKIQGGTVSGFCRAGIDVGDAPGLRISDVTITRNDQSGINLRNCPKCRVVDSRVTDNGAGIRVFSNNQGTRISDNVVSNNSIGLIVQSESTGVRLTDNVAAGNGDVDLRDDNPSTAEGCANTWRDNKFGSAGGAGATCIQ